MRVRTPPCVYCGDASVVKLTDAEYAALTHSSRPLIDQALPDRDADFRELVMSGTHPECWDAMFKEDQ